MTFFGCHVPQRQLIRKGYFLCVPIRKMNKVFLPLVPWGHVFPPMGPPGTLLESIQTFLAFTMTPNANAS